MKFILMTICLVCLTTGVAQDFEHEVYDWSGSPELEVIDTALLDEEEVRLQVSRILEFAYSEDYNNRLVEYVTVHEKTRVLTDDAIQRNNKVYIGMGNVLELVSAKARVITPENKIIEFDESNIMESESDEDQGSYKYFAIDGAVKGSDIEYMYTILRVPKYNGIRNTFQNEITSLATSFSLLSPSNLHFEFRSYNDFPEIIQDTSIHDKNVYRANSGRIDGLRDEDYSAYGKNLQYIVYKLDRNTATYATNLSSFGDVSQNVYQYYHGEMSKSDQKAIKKLVGASGAAKEEQTEQKIWILENYIKNEIMAVDGVPMQEVDDIVSSGFTSGMGLSYIIAHSLNYLDIEFEIVLTCDRFNSYFDEDFENYYIIDNVLFYFPEIKKYMAPEEGLFRLGLVPSEWTNQKGLFIKEVGVGDIKTGMGKVKFIDPVPASMTADKMEVLVLFTDMLEPEVEFKRELSGYSTVYFQSVYGMIDEDGRKELDEGLIKFADDKGEVISYELTGTEKEDFGKNPMVYTGKLRTNSLIEKAGNRYLFKVGQLIGPQAEMYQEEERKLDIEHDHNMVYERVITFDIPDGYELTGLDELKIHEQYPLDDPTISFTSDYTIEGNTVKITVTEVYKQMLFDRDEINEFRRIINAAANFNKVVLFLNQK